ncbi:hypothetical protein BDY19DRAFT_480836 [Irpex rosettiformis]|uniref:Uncharacterized protein n=1 Tax=Irpex rosettiformis TaxID=378272 RepID=A0ACB8UDJ8_9APHY|nr:hypothetical protein BDY19DRAFT_480836 [Irpex rosettiformis]
MARTSRLHARVHEHGLFHITAIFLVFLLGTTSSYAQPAVVQYQDCFSGSNTTQKLNISTVYAQLIPDNGERAVLNFTLIGSTPQTIVEASSDQSNPVATTLFTTTSMLTFDIWNNNSYFCATLRPPSPLSNPDTAGMYCPLGPGDFALSSSIHLGSDYPLATYNTRLRALDPSQNELLCLDLSTTPVKPNSLDPIVGEFHTIFWGTVALAIGYWLVVGIARLVTARGRGSNAGKGIWAKVEGAGFILASAISGERLATSPALMRFCTPSLRDIIFHTQWCATLAMVAVQWPGFIYPIFSQTAWSMLVYNVSISQGSDAKTERWNPLAVQPFQPPSEFADQLNDPSSPIFINATASNVIFQLPTNASDGIESFAYAVGLRPQDLFGICLSIFLAIIAATVVLSLIVWSIDWFASFVSGTFSRPASALGESRSPRYSATSKDMLEGLAQLPTSEDRTTSGHPFLRTASRFPFGRRMQALQIRFVSFHGSVLQGNLIRILILFHLPVTIFSCYQMTLGRGRATLASIILAALSFAILSVLLPILLVLRLSITNTTKLYDETWTLLSLGPLYNHYRHGSQLFACLLFATNIAFGVTIGCGQKSGTAQAIIILVVEVASALGTSIWLPWGHGASMGLISFLFCVARIVVAVLLVILTPVVSIGTGPGQWVAYAILVILALVYLAFAMMLLVKLVEVALRITGHVGFDESKHAVDSGLLGVMNLMGCCGSRRRPHRSSRAMYQSTHPVPQSLNLGRPAAPLYRDITPTSSGPPSVLRPEHALQRYKEESDDETGYIMGAWQPFPGPGYSPVESTPPAPEPSKSGFTRVGGGRAHYESPYAITNSSIRGSTQTFPSVERHNVGPSSLSNVISPDDLTPPSPSMGNAATPATAKTVDPGLPPGAMPPGQPPSHVRTKSQTAIIENAPLISLSDPPPSASIGNFGAADDTAAVPQKKKWYNIRSKNRRYSEADQLDMPAVEPERSEPEPGRSFVVVRKGRSGAANKDASTSSEPAEKRSFQVLRGPVAS